jgi:hypothetical protein
MIHQIGRASMTIEREEKLHFLIVLCFNSNFDTPCNNLCDSQLLVKVDDFQSHPLGKSARGCWSVV